MPRTPLIWRFRIEDLTRVLDELDLIEVSAPGLRGRLNGDRIAATGHSYGATTASALLGARVLDRQGNTGEDMSDPRVAAGLLLALAGTGGEDLTPFAAEMFPFMNPKFDAMTTPALITAGDHDQSPLSVRGPDWWTDAYRLSPGEKSLLTLRGRTLPRRHPRLWRHARNSRRKPRAGRARSADDHGLPTQRA